MAAQSFELILTGFRFPRDLSGSRANFRFVADLRYVNRRGDWMTDHAVMPSLDTFWECDPGKPKAPNYVRAADDGAFGRFDMNRIDDWDRLILLVRAGALHSVQFKVFDVNRPDVWDRLREALAGLVRAILGRARDAAGRKDELFSDSLGSAASDLESAVVKRLAGGDRVLFRGSTRLEGPGTYSILGAGTGGDYALDFEVRLA
ncbi:MAG: hypothetical protein ACE5HF_10495 [Gemmatimonadota bacterium]